MIVKDEAEGIAETIRSVRDVVDFYTIVDTGSTDGTQEIISECFGSTPGEIVQEPFVDYATTRNRALEIGEMSTTFSLMLSGDETLSEASGLREFLESKRGSYGGAYNISVRMANDIWKATRITRAGSCWRYVGATHEVCVGPNGPGILDSAPGLIVHETKRRTFQKMNVNWKRDVALLTAELNRNPSDTRSTFYLAQSYEMLGQYDLASFGYQKRVELGGWREEVYESLWRIAKLKFAMGLPWAECEEAFLKAFSFSPHRAEPLVVIGRHYLEIHNGPVARLFLERACALEYPAGDVLFVDSHSYEVRYDLLAQAKRDPSMRILTGDLDIDQLKTQLEETKVFVSLTTLPSRMRQLELTIASIERQRFKPDGILLGLPTMSKREGTPYAIPQELVDRVTVISTEDRGPGTKLYSALDAIHDPDTIIITVDDDVEYEEHVLEKLVAASLRHPHAAIGFCGWNAEKLIRGGDYELMYEENGNWPSNPAPANVLEGYRGIAYRRGFFDADVLDYEFHEGAFFVDDVWISGYLALKGIPRLVTRYSDVTLTQDEVWETIWKQNGLDPASNGLHLMPNFRSNNREVAATFEARSPGIWRKDLVKIFDKIELSMDEQRQRDKPHRYMKAALELLGYGCKTIVEIGSARQRLVHPLHETHHDCCIDGHSTYLWAASRHRVVSVDISQDHTEIARSIPGVEAVTKDGIEFLREFSEPIDLLFLDAWDVVSETPYAEKHLEAYLAASGNLALRHVIVIDDTDIASGGKGRLLVPHLLEKGYHRLMSGRQTILSSHAPDYQDSMEATFDRLYKGAWRGVSGPGSTPEYTVEYREYLEELLIELRIERVLDLGCGDWSFSRLINWWACTYHGVDCVWDVVAANRSRFSWPGYDGFTFEHANIQDYPLPTDDSRTLIVVKDVLQHWSSDAVLDFLGRLDKSSAYALIVNCDVGPGVNSDIREGDWRPLALNAPPFCAEFKEVMRFHTKSVLLRSPSHEGFASKMGSDLNLPAQIVADSKMPRRALAVSK